MPGVYVSYPFCAQKCSFCNFASDALPHDLESRYLDAVIAEINAHGWQWTPETLYLGGGTPSRIEPASIGRLIGAIAAAAPERPAYREATIEAAPGSLTAGAVRAWRERGINRVSLGVQSFVARELARTGRKHRAETVAGDIALLAAHGIANLNIDLIAGLPGQTAASWRESLDWIERLAPAHVSVYMFEIDDGSRLGRELLSGGTRYGAGDAPSESLTVELYESAVDRLTAIGIPRYEISNFARPGFESLHNLKYWRMEPYVGFGAGAHSFDGATRWHNVETAAEYVQRGGLARAAQSPARLGQERLFTGLRLSAGLPLTPGDWRLYGDAIRRRIHDGLLELDAQGAARLTRRGVLLSNEVFSEFVSL
jgi:oxygen-independent coproporphyrinogen-3 oxidase